LRHQALRRNGLEILFHHLVAILYLPLYAKSNATALQQDWPRIPLPSSKEQLIHSAELGRQIASLFDTDNPVAHVTTGTVGPELAAIAIVSRSGGGALNPDAGDLDVTAGWGHSGTGGAVMPGRGRAIEGDYSAQERESILRAASALGLSDEKALSLLGGHRFDVYLNNFAYWKNLPARVWEYRVGGYQVIKKWLSYRERGILGRSLTIDKTHYVTAMARRIAAILLLQSQLDTNYQTVTQSTYPWPSSNGALSDNPSPTPR